MSHWLWLWTERIARLIAELWLRSRSDPGGVGGSNSAEPPSSSNTVVTSAPTDAVPSQ